MLGRRVWIPHSAEPKERVKCGFFWWECRRFRASFAIPIARVLSRREESEKSVEFIDRADESMLNFANMFSSVGRQCWQTPKREVNSLDWNWMGNVLSLEYSPGRPRRRLARNCAERSKTFHYRQFRFRLFRVCFIEKKSEKMEKIHVPADEFDLITAY